MPVLNSRRVDEIRQPAIGDAFGALLRAQWRNLDVSLPEIVERDDGFLGTGVARGYFDPPEKWSDLDRAAVDAARGRVLDVGCGGGRHAVELIRRGLDVTGLEPSPGAAEVSRDRGVTVVEAAVDQVSGGPFDTILMLGNNLGLLGGPERGADVHDRLARVAAPGALLIGAGTDPHGTDAPHHLAYHEWNRAHGRLGGQLRIRVRHAQLATEWFDYWFATIDELSAVVAAGRWSLDRVDSDGPVYLATLRLRG